jgi:hypothetical protein
VQLLEPLAFPVPDGMDETELNSMFVEEFGPMYAL